MSNPPPDPFDPDDPAIDPWADDPLAPKEPGRGPAARGPAALLDPDTRGRIEHEILYQQTKAALAAAPPAAPPRWADGAILLALAAALAGAALAAGSARPAGLLLAVVLAHDLGHLAGMWVFGFRDARLFLLPYLDALAPAGEAVAPGRRGVTVLLGPLPGVFAGLIVTVVARPPAGTWVADLCLLLVALNGVTLLPVVPLDGGRLVDLLELTRRPWAGTAVRLAAAAGLGLAAVFADGWPAAVALGLLAGLAAAAAPVMHRLARSRRVLRAVLPGLPERFAALTDAQRRKVFAVALVVYPVPDPDRLAGVIRNLHARAAPRAAGPAAGAGLLAAYLLGVAGVAGFAWVAAG